MIVMRQSQDKNKTKTTPSSNYRDRYRTYSRNHPSICFRLDPSTLELYYEYARGAYSLKMISRPSVALLARKALEEYGDSNKEKFAKENVRLYEIKHPNY